MIQIKAAPGLLSKFVVVPQLLGVAQSSGVLYFTEGFVVKPIWNSCPTVNVNCFLLANIVYLSYCRFTLFSKLAGGLCNFCDLKSFVCSSESLQAAYAGYQTRDNGSECQPTIQRRPPPVAVSRVMTPFPGSDFFLKIRISC